MTLRSGGGRFDNSKKNSCSTDRFLSLLQVYDHHQKIMSCNSVKKMTQSAIPDLNVVSDKTHYYRHQEQFMQLASLTMIALATIFEMNFMESWQSLQTQRFFTYSERSTRTCVDKPQCNSQFLAMVMQMKHLFFFFFFFSHIMWNKFSIRHVPLHYV